MTIRITKIMAAEAAQKAAEAKYSGKMDELQEKINMIGEKLVKKHIPSPVLAVTAEYNKYIEGRDYAIISHEKENLGGYSSTETYIRANLSIQIPRSCVYVYVDKEEYSEIRRVFDEMNAIERAKNDMEHEITNALMSLKTYKRVQECLPNVLKYIDIPEGSMLPMKVYDELNKLIPTDND